MWIQFQSPRAFLLTDEPDLHRVPARVAPALHESRALQKQTPSRASTTRACSDCTAIALLLLPGCPLLLSSASPGPAPSRPDLCLTTADKHGRSLSAGCVAKCRAASSDLQPSPRGPPLLSPPPAHVHAATAASGLPLTCPCVCSRLTSLC